MKTIENGYEFDNTGKSLTRIVGETVFNYDPDEQMFYVVSKEFWNKKHCILDHHIDDSFMPDGFEQVAESMFEYSGTIQEGKDKLLAINITEVQF